MSSRSWVGFLALAVAGCTCADKPAPAEAPSATRIHSPERDAPPTKDQAWLKPRITADLGPASGAVAGGTGVVWIGNDQRSHLSPLPKDDAGSFAPITNASSESPALGGRHAYWIHAGKLQRHELDASAGLETIAADARDGSRVLTVPGTNGWGVLGISTPSALLYVTNAGVALLKQEGKPSIPLSSDGTLVDEIAFLRVADERLVAAYLAAGSLHVRNVDLSQGLELREDVTIWNAETPAKPAGLALGVFEHNEVWALVATDAGLGQVKLGKQPSPGTPIVWRKPATPIVAFRLLCREEPVALYVRGSADGKEELRIEKLGREGLGEGQTLARGTKFQSASFSLTDAGVLFVYVADGRTFASLWPC